MKKVMRNLLFFIILAALLIVPGKILTPNYMIDHNLVSGRNAVYSGIASQEKNSLDVIAVGDSLSYSSMNPMELWLKYGYTSYDGGQPGAKLQETVEVLRLVFQTQKPSVILLETNGFFRKVKASSLTQQKSDLAEVIYNTFPILRYHNFWKTLFTPFSSQSFMGFSINRSVKPYKGGDYMEETGKIKNIPEANIESLHAIEKLCEENGASLILYSAPSPKNYTVAKHNALEELAADENLEYIDLNTKLKELNISWDADTRDKGDHLNFFGAEKTTAYLGSYLADHYDLQDHRNDDVAAVWNALAAKYLKAKGGNNA
ncbi:MAG: hypothetical protein PUA95_00450 [Lactimicrobium massiliense]|nr:hypothetical protein [Lactimicrobium massiliense]MDD6229181.1 hypothetical protein [Lactimicrobium massiliense]MDD6560293.1 hypothetical protein [Lactimicrobium massiliense]